MSLKMADDERIFCVKMTTSGNNVERLCFLVRKMSESETISEPKTLQAIDVTSICFSDRKIVLEEPKEELRETKAAGGFNAYDDSPVREKKGLEKESRLI